MFYFMGKMKVTFPLLNDAMGCHDLQPHRKNAFVDPWDIHGRYTGESGFGQRIWGGIAMVYGVHKTDKLCGFYIEISSLSYWSAHFKQLSRTGHMGFLSLLTMTRGTREAPRPDEAIIVSKLVYQTTFHVTTTFNYNYIQRVTIPQVRIAGNCKPWLYLPTA